MLSKLLSKHSLSDLIGEIFLVEINESKLTEREKKIIEEIVPGGFVIKQNKLTSIDNLRNICRELEESYKSLRSGVIPFIAIEHSFGENSNLIDEITPIPSAMTIGATGDPSLAYSVAYIMALELRAIGINMNFSPPVKAINENEKYMNKYFWDNLSDNQKFLSKYNRGLKSGGVIGVTRYFPVYLKKKGERISIKELSKKVEIKNFVNDAEAIMISHEVIEDEDKAYVPASLSKKVVQKLLKNSLGYQGLVITESLFNEEILRSYEVSEATVKAIEAGNDIMIVGNDEKLYELIDKISKKIDEDLVFMEKVKRAIVKVLKKKENLRYYKKPPTKVIGCKSHKSEILKIVRNAVALVFDSGVLPIDFKTHNVLFLVPSGIYTKILTLSEKYGIEKENIYKNDYRYLQNFLIKSRRYDYVVIFTYNLIYCRKREIESVNRIVAESKRSVVIATGSPFDILLIKRPNSYIVTYSPDIFSLTVAMEVLMGKTKARGRIPKKLEEMLKEVREDEKSKSEGN